MKLVKPTVELVQENGATLVELAARNCYLSEYKEDTERSNKFIKSLIDNKHYSMLEFFTKYYYVPINSDYVLTFLLWGDNNAQVQVVEETDGLYITTNLRRVLEDEVWSTYTEEFENISEIIEKYECEQTNKHSKRITFKITDSIQVCRDIMRHRAFSFSQESTRYNLYSKNKYNSELTFIEPLLNIPKVLDVFKSIEDVYLAISKDYKNPQEFSNILPLGLKSEVYMCGFEVEYEHFLDLRLLETTGKVRPEVKILASKIKELL